MAASAPVSSSGSLSLNTSYSASICEESLTNCDIFCRRIETSNGRERERKRDREKLYTNLYLNEITDLYKM